MPKILLVDDDPIFAELFRTRISHYEAVHEPSYKRARTRIKQDGTYSFVAVVVDYALGDGSGGDFCHWLRSKDPDIPILLVTALEIELYEKVVADVNPTGSFQKPITDWKAVQRMIDDLPRPGATS